MVMDRMIEYSLAALVFFPFLAGLLIFGVESRRRGAGKYGSGVGIGRSAHVLAVLFAAAELLLAVFLAVLFYLRSGMMLLNEGGAGAEAVMRLALPEVCGFGLYFEMDGFRLIYSLVTVFAWLMATICSGEYFEGHRNVGRFYLFLLATQGATLGVFLSADLLTLFLFFEIMSLASCVWVAQEETREALRAAETYLAIAVIGGLAVLMGLFLVYYVAGEWGVYTPGSPLYFEELGELYRTVREAELTGLPSGPWASPAFSAGPSLSVSPAEALESARVSARLLRAAGLCMLVGFGAKAGAFPLHIWLPKAHSEAPAPASALLSGILTKTGIFGILILSCRLFWHEAGWGSLMLAVGVLTMLTGALLALFSVHLKRALACSSVSQIGFILMGVGMQGLLGAENAAAVHGTLLHMVNHSLIKLVLFLAAGVIYKNTHTLDLNGIRGFGRKKPLLMGAFLTGALALCGIPFFGGYVSKTLLHEAIAAYGGGGFMRAVEWAFLFSGGLTLAYMTKLFVAVFVEKNADAALQARYDGVSWGEGESAAPDGVFLREGESAARDGGGVRHPQKPVRRYRNRAAAFALAESAFVLLVWGLFPHSLMDRAAGLGQGFFGLTGKGEVVNYFSLENLRGAAISAGIGVFVYLFFVRGVLMKKYRALAAARLSSQESSMAEQGAKIYRDLWPRRLDLENLLYRPLLLRILPALFGVLCRILDSFVDAAVVLLRKTVYRDSPLPRERREGSALSAALGKIGNALQALGNHTWSRKHPGNRDYVRLFALGEAEARENSRIIRRSLSFGLLLVGVGLMLTLVYLIWW